MDSQGSNNRAGGVPPGFNIAVGTPSGFNNRGPIPTGFNNRVRAPPGFENRMPGQTLSTMPALTADADEQRTVQTNDREYLGQSEFFSRAQSLGIRVGTPTHASGVHDNAGTQDPDKTPTQASVFPRSQNRNTTPTQASVFAPPPQPQNTSSFGGRSFEQARKEFSEMMAKQKPENQNAKHDALALQFVRDFTASHQVGPADKAAPAKKGALDGTELGQRNKMKSVGGDSAAWGGSMFGHEVGLPTNEDIWGMRGHEVGLHRNDNTLGGDMAPLGGTMTAQAGSKNSVGSHKLTTPFNSNNTAASFISPSGVGFASYSSPSHHIHAEPELRRAFKVASDRKKLLSDQDKAIPGLGNVVPGPGNTNSAYPWPGSAYETLGSAYDKAPSYASTHEKYGSAYKKTDPAYEEPSTHGKAGPGLDLATHRDQLLQELKKGVPDSSKASHAVYKNIFSLSDSALAMRDGSWDRGLTTSESGFIADEASTDAFSNMGMDNREAVLFHRKAIQELQNLSLRHETAHSSHENAAALHQDLVARTQRLVSIHKNRLRFHTELLAQEANAPLKDEDITHNTAATLHGDVLPCDNTARGLPFYGVIAPPSLPGVGQHRTIGQQGGNTTNTSTDRCSSQTKEQAFASRAEAHGIRIRIRCVDAKDKGAEGKGAKEKDD